MRPVQNAGGHVGLSARPYPIAAATDVKDGQVVKLSGGLVVLASASETGKLLGIAGENHPGTADALNPRSNGEDIMVYDNPELIFECDAPVVTAADSSATTVVAASGEIAGTIANDALNGGVLVLKSKASGSTNTDPVGVKKTITDYVAATLTMTVASAGTAKAGDKFYLYPPLGSAVMGLDSGITKAIVSATGATAVKVVGHDILRGKLRLMAVLHHMGVED